jgi:hypothetical protein
MKTVRDACVLKSGALEIKLADQVEQLDELIHAEGNGEAYFKKTFITGGMRDLVTEGIARLAGKSTQAIFHLKQAMGGGKTHLLVGFGLLAKHATLRKKICPEISHIEGFGSAKIAAFNGRNSPEGFFWGEIATQLGKGDQFAKYWTGGPKAPDESAWTKLFDGDEPVLILLDEMPPYFQDLDTQKVGNGTVADIATRALANMLSAAGKKKNVCVVISDLAAAYASGTSLINRALTDARSEVGRQERSITPVDLSANEIYEILRKRLFEKLPTQEEVDKVADAFSRKLEEAAKGKSVRRGAEATADEIAQTYPFHPLLKNVIALFKDNEQFKQTRGLIELVSRLLKSVWKRDSNDVFLIGPQHFDLSIPEVREKLTEISGMRDVIAKDLWDQNQSAHAQVIDLSTGNDAARQVGALVFTASLSTAVNAIKGLTKQEMVECLITPLMEPSEFLAAFDSLEQEAWYLHHTADEKYYFDRQENLTKLLQSLAHDAPDPKVDDLIRSRLKEMFTPSRKTCYGEVLPLPKLDEAADRLRRGRVLLIVSPDSKVPPEEVQRFYDGLTQKNNVCILTGDRTAMATIEKAARQLFASKAADSRIPKTHPQREDLERKQAQYEHDMTSTVLGLFDKVLFPRCLAGRAPELAAKALDQSRDNSQPYNGEEQIEKTLTAHPLKLYLDIQRDFDAACEKAQDLLWPEGQDVARWSDIEDRYAEQAGMPWLPPKGLEQLKETAINRGRWEDLGGGQISKNPQRKKTSVQVVAEPEAGDDGRVRLTINAQHAGPAPRIHVAEDGPVTESSPILTEPHLSTTALKVALLVIDPSGQHETGDPFVWANSLKLRTELVETGGKRQVKLFVSPRADIRYTTDGSNPRSGTVYEGPFEIGEKETTVQAFASADGLEVQQPFTFPAKGKKGVTVDPVKPAKLACTRGQKLDSRAKTFDGLKEAREKQISFEGVTLNIGQGAKIVNVAIGEISVDADFIEDILKKVLEKFPADAPVTLMFRKGHFQSGHDLSAFAEKLGIQLEAGSVEQ